MGRLEALLSLSIASGAVCLLGDGPGGWVVWVLDCQVQPINDGDDKGPYLHPGLVAVP